MIAASRNAQIGIAILAVPVLFLGICPLQARIDAQTAVLAPQQQELLLRSPKLLKELSLGFDSLLADVYWTRTVQYYGTKLAHHDPQLDLLAPLLDLTTALDPHLLVAYKFGAIFLAEPAPVGAGRSDLAAGLVQRGIAANPEEWSLWATLGFNYYWYEKDYRKAADVYLEGSKQPGAQDWMRGMAAKILEEGGSAENSRFLWTQLYQSTQEPALRKNAYEHLRALKAEEDVGHLAELAAEYQRRFGHDPARIRDMIAAGMLRGEPVDPAGFPYILEPDGKVRLNPDSPIKSDILKPVIRR